MTLLREGSDSSVWLESATLARQELAMIEKCQQSASVLVDGRVQCNFCAKYYKNQQSLRGHQLRDHSAKQPISVCDGCDKRFPLLASVQAHIRFYHLYKQKTTPQCYDCGQKYSYYKGLAKHFQLRHLQYTASPVVCFECESAFATVSYLLSHFNHCQVRKEFGCNGCGKRLPTILSLTKHLCARRAQTDRPKNTKKARYLCDDCSGKNLFEKKILVDHCFAIHFLRDDGTTTTSKFQCRVCERIYLNRNTLRVHKCWSKERFGCTLCERSYSEMTTLKKHMKMWHDAEQIVHQCDLCEYVTRKKGDLITHAARVHFSTEIVARFASEQCNASIVKVKNRQLLLQCSKCVKCFKTVGALRRHEHRHVNNAKDFCCTACNQTFARKAHLNEHEQMHAVDPKHFPCPVCEKSYLWSDGLNKHMKSAHNVDRKKQIFECDLCDKAMTN